MKIKSLPIQGLKAGPDDGLAEGEFLVYPSTFTRTPDSYGDVVAKGAFINSIAEWKSSGDVLPGMYMHDPMQIVAGAIDQGEDAHGWWVKGKFDPDPAAQRIYGLVKGRRLSSLSFAFDVIDEGGVQLEDGRKANELRELRVHEFSFLPKGFAANGDTSVIAVKAFTDRVADAIKRGLPVDIDALRKSHETLAALIAAMDVQADGEPVPADEEPSRAKSGPVPHSHDLVRARLLELDLAL